MTDVAVPSPPRTGSAFHQLTSLDIDSVRAMAAALALAPYRDCGERRHEVTRALRQDLRVDHAARSRRVPER
jgi:hypothetical protein